MNSLKKILGVGALTLALAGANCRNDVAYVPEVERVRNVEVVDDGVDINREYSFQDFKRVLGERYDPKKENELNEFWESYSNEDRELILGVFDYSGGVDGYAKKFEKFLPPTFMKGYEEYCGNVKNSSGLDFIPWKIISEQNLVSETDKLGMYVTSGLSIKNSDIPLF